MAPIFCHDIPAPRALTTVSTSCCSVRARATTARWRWYSSTGISLPASGSKSSNVWPVRRRGRGCLGLIVAWCHLRNLAPSGHGVNDEVDSVTVATPISSNLPGVARPDQHPEIVEGEDSGGVAIGVDHVVVVDPVLACAVDDTGSTPSTYLDDSRGATHPLRTDAMKERGLRSPGVVEQPGAAGSRSSVTPDLHPTWRYGPLSSNIEGRAQHADLGT